MSHNPFDNFINDGLNTNGFEPISANQGEPEHEADDHRGTTPPQRSVAIVSSDEAALDAAASFMGRPLTAAEKQLVLSTMRNGGGPVELDAIEGDDDDEETLEIEPQAQPTLSELFSHSGDDPEIDDVFSDFMDTLPDPNATSLWESKLDDLQLQLRGLVTNEVYQNFVDGHYAEWMPDANDFATMESYQRARKQEIVKIKYLISFAISLMSLAEGHLRRTMGHE